MTTKSFAAFKAQRKAIKRAQRRFVARPTSKNAHKLEMAWEHAMSVWDRANPGIKEALVRGVQMLIDSRKRGGPN